MQRQRQRRERATSETLTRRTRRLRADRVAVLVSARASCENRATCRRMSHRWPLGGAVRSVAVPWWSMRRRRLSGVRRRRTGHRRDDEGDAVARVEGQVAVVTGGASGIGRAAAGLLADNGVRRVAGTGVRGVAPPGGGGRRAARVGRAGRPCSPEPASPGSGSEPAPWLPRPPCTGRSTAPACCSPRSSGTGEPARARFLLGSACRSRATYARVGLVATLLEYGRASSDQPGRRQPGTGEQLLVARRSLLPQRPRLTAD